MKKLLLLGVMSVAIMTGCGDTDDMQVISPREGEILSEKELCSDVPFRFVADSIEIQTDFDGVTRGSNEGKLMDNFGLFCLAKQPIKDGVTGKKSPSWSGKASAEINKHSVWKKNIPISVRYSTDNRINIIYDNPINPDTLPYYPEKEWFSYGFVAYHPRTENIVYTQATITAYIKLDGREKVMYSMAKEPKDLFTDDEVNKWAFSKPYFEYLGEGPQSGAEEFVYPYFSFQTLTSTLNFYFFSKDEPVSNLHIDKVEFDDFPCIMMLGLATMLRDANKIAYDMKSSIATSPFIKNDNIFSEKGLDQFPELTSAFGHYELYEENGESISGQKNADGSYKYTLTTEKRKMGGSIYIPPVYAAHSRSTLKIFLTLADDYGNKYKCQSPVEVPAPANGWGRNTQYNIKIMLNNPSEVAKDASLAEWKLGDPIVIDATSKSWTSLP
jgi:hypothetical protein